MITNPEFLELRNSFSIQITTVLLHIWLAVLVVLDGDKESWFPRFMIGIQVFILIAEGFFRMFGLK